MYADVTSGSLRIGAVNEMLMHPGTELIHAIIRGGWDMTNSSAMFEYVLQSRAGLTIGARALAGYSNVRQLKSAPKLPKLHVDSEDCTKLNILRKRVFDRAELQQKNLQMYSDTMLASLLQHLERMQSKYGSNAVTSSLFQKAKDCGISDEVLIAWGKEIDERWQLENVSIGDAHDTALTTTTFDKVSRQLSSLTDNYNAIQYENNKMLLENRQLHETVQSLTTKVDSLEDKIKILNGNIGQILNILQERDERPCKRTRTDTTETTVDTRVETEINVQDTTDISDCTGFVPILEPPLPRLTLALRQPMKCYVIHLPFSQLTIGNFLTTWFERKLYNVHTLWKFDDTLENSVRMDKKKSTTNMVMKFATKQLTPQQMQVTMARDSMTQEDNTDKLKWITDMNFIATDLQISVFDYILEQEIQLGLRKRTKDNSRLSNGFDALYKRIQDIQKSTK